MQIFVIGSSRKFNINVHLLYNRGKRGCKVSAKVYTHRECSVDLCVDRDYYEENAKLCSEREGGMNACTDHEGNAKLCIQGKSKGEVKLGIKSKWNLN